MITSFCGVEGDSGITISKAVDFKWFYDLIDWGISIRRTSISPFYLDVRI